MAKQTFTATGTSTTPLLSRHGVTYYADFTGAVGSARVEININGDWVPLTAAVTATTATATVVPNDRGGDAAQYRWNVTAYTSGNIVLYLA